jgi:intracellular septation protein
MKLLFDVFPVILFFVFFKFGNSHPETADAILTAFDIVLAPSIKPAIFLATLVSIFATTVQIVWTKLRHGKVDAMLWLSFFVIVLFGGATLIFHNDTFIRWKPTVLYWLFSGALMGSNLIFKKNLIRSALSNKMALPVRIWNLLNLSWGLFFLALGFINLYVAYNYSIESWVNFKLFGFTGLMLIFIVAQSAWLSKYMNEDKENN